MPTIYPSLMSVSKMNLEYVIKQLDPHVSGYHLDVMDNQFVPNALWDAQTVNAIAQMTRHNVWVHLMVINPQDWIDTLTLMPGAICTFHYEAIGSDTNIIHRIKEKGWHASIAINPDTPVEKIFSLLPLIDQVLIMSVQPGFAGQPFIADIVHKLEPLIGYRASRNLNFRIGMDGGISLSNIKELAQQGVDDFAVSSAIFGYPDPVEALKILEDKLAL